MPLLDLFLNAFVAMNEVWASPWLLLVFAVAAAPLGAKAVEVIPFTRRIIERRERATDDVV